MLRDDAGPGRLEHGPTWGTLTAATGHDQNCGGRHALTMSAAAPAAVWRKLEWVSAPLPGKLGPFPPAP